MATPQPQVTVVIATRNRPARLSAQLEALRAQTLDTVEFEVIVVDDASDDPEVADVLAAAEAAPSPRTTVIRNRAKIGTSAARNLGWRSAAAPLVAFTDDDCEAAPRWLAAGLAAWEGDLQRFVQGRTAPIERERAALGIWSYTIEVPELALEFQTCNIFYPREMLERLGGFDAETHPTSGEDTDLAWRAIAAGATPVFAPDALAHHAVVAMTPRSLLRRAWHFSDAIIPFGKHPELRRKRLIGGLFWNWSHYLLMRGLLAAALPRRLWPLSLWLAWPLLRFQLQRARENGGGPQHVPWLLFYDSVEVAAVLRGAIRGRTIVI